MESKKKKKGFNEPRGRTGIKTQPHRMDLKMGRGKGKLGQSERVALTYVHYQM